MSQYVQCYHQCWLVRGSAKQMAWIPAKFAVAGRYLKLTENGEAEDGWQVAGIGARIPAEDVRERSQDYKHTRQASDI